MTERDMLADIHRELGVVSATQQMILSNQEEERRVRGDHGQRLRSLENSRSWALGVVAVFTACGAWLARMLHLGG